MPNQSPLRKELHIELEEYAYIQHEELGEDKFRGNYDWNLTIDNLLDVLIHALPEEDNIYKDDVILVAFAQGSNKRLKEVKQLLLEAKGDK